MSDTHDTYCACDLFGLPSFDNEDLVDKSEE